MVNAQLPFKTVAELVAYAKANPGKLNYSTGGIGTLPHLAAELFKKTTGTNIVHVPYKGGGPALTGVMAGEVQMTFDPVAHLAATDQGRQAARARDRRPEARCRPARRADHGGKRLPVSHRRRLDRAAGAQGHAAGDHRQAQRRREQAALQSEPMKSTLARLGAEPRGGTPQALADHMANETKRWKPIVESIDLKVN